TAEGGTGGLVADWLGGVDGAEGYYLGGLIAVGDEAVRRSLDVPATLIAKHSTASSEAAAAMAVGCRRRFQADYGLAVSSFPRYEPDAAEPKPVFFALATPEGVKLKQVPFAGHPALLKIYAAKHMLDLLRLTMLEKQ
ncbi:MAG: nicotinamide-nucleotide amidohydrolase family protein, partial [Planctomycetota bacterium]